MFLTVVPAYGRDYKSKKEVMQAWSEGKDFLVDCMMRPELDGKYLNKDDAPKGATLNVRYLRQTRVCVIKVK